MNLNELKSSINTTIGLLNKYVDNLYELKNNADKTLIDELIPLRKALQRFNVAVLEAKGDLF